MEDLVASAVAGHVTPAGVRLVLRPHGAVEVETSALDDELPAGPLRLCVDPEPVHSTDVMLFHKTTNRGRYSGPRPAAPDRRRRHSGKRVRRGNGDHPGQPGRWLGRPVVYPAAQLSVYVPGLNEVGSWPRAGWSSVWSP